MLVLKSVDAQMFGLNKFKYPMPGDVVSHRGKELNPYQWDTGLHGLEIGLKLSWARYNIGGWWLLLDTIERAVDYGDGHVMFTSAKVISRHRRLSTLFKAIKRPEFVQEQYTVGGICVNESGDCVADWEFLAYGKKSATGKYCMAADRGGFLRCNKAPNIIGRIGVDRDTDGDVLKPRKFYTLGLDKWRKVETHE